MLTKENFKESLTIINIPSKKVWDRLIDKLYKLGWIGYSNYNKEEIKDSYSIKGIDKIYLPYYSGINDFSIHPRSSIEGKTQEPSYILEEEKEAFKPFPRDFYVKVNSQEEADKFFEFLEENGEKVITTSKFRDGSASYIVHYVNAWFLNQRPIGKERSLSDFIDVNPLNNKKCVHAASKEQWNFIISKIYPHRTRWIYSPEDKPNQNGANCISLDTEGHCRIGWYKNLNYQILSFEEWMREAGYDFKEFKSWEFVQPLPDKYIMAIDPIKEPTPKIKIKGKNKLRIKNKIVEISNNKLNFKLKKHE